MDKTASLTYCEHIAGVSPSSLVLLMRSEKMLARSLAAEFFDHGCTGIEIETV
jgi:hypothetical protein